MQRLRTRSSCSLLLVGVLAAITLGCAAGRGAYRQGGEAGLSGDWDTAVEYYRQALEDDPDRAEYRIALERALLSASREHMRLARQFEANDELASAVFEYRKANEFDPSNQQAAAKAAELEREIRERIEAARPRPAIDQLREQVRQQAAAPLLNPASTEPLQFQFNNAGLREILDFIGDATGINVTYDQQFQDRQYSVRLDGIPMQEALHQILTANQSFYKVLNSRTIIVVPDTPQKRAQYEEQVIRTFYVSHGDVQEISQLISSVIRVPQMAVQPMVAINQTANTITIRATTAVADVIERIIEANDKPRAEVIIDVEILEVNRESARQYGLNLSQYAIGTVFSPELAPPNESTPPASVTSPPPFNLNTISRGVSPADFFLAVPAAFVRFLETDSRSKLIAKPQLRGQEGQQLTLNLGDEIPVPTTAFSPIATGGAAVNPLTSFNYRPIGVIVEMTPRVTYEDEIILDLTVENSTLGPNIEVAGSSLPTFGSRRVVTRLRLRDGESNLLAGLLREEERQALRGFPGILRLPFLSRLLSDNDETVRQTDIVMLLTPRIVRSHELTREDLSPIHIGTQQNIGLTGPPSLIAAPPVDAGEAPAPAGGAPAPIPPAMPDPLTPAGPPPGAAPAVAPTPPEATPPPLVPALPPGAFDVSNGIAEIVVTTPGTELNVAGGPYTVPISISGASRVSTVSITLTYNAAVMRVRSVQEGSFMRQGGSEATFTQEVDPVSGRIDMTITRSGDAVGASGAGLLAAVLFDTVAPGMSSIDLSGIATTPEGGPLPVQFTQAAVTVR